VAQRRNVITALLPAVLCAQQAAPDEIRVSSRPYVTQSPYGIRVETKLVELNVAVRDWKGRAIRAPSSTAKWPRRTHWTVFRAGQSCRR
jgi:hypothetical protein